MFDHQESSGNAGSVLVIDDEAANLQLLSEILTGAGYQVRPARLPQLAIDASRARPPDLILLDVMMPEMNGFEVCRRLKQDDRTRDIPVIFVSALHDVEDRVRGFEQGGVDFISKPFQESEILARVGTHVSLHRMRVDLEGLVASRTAELTMKNRALEAEIEERNQAEEALRESRRFNDQLIETANVAIVGLDTQGIVILANPAVESLTGYGCTELLGREWFEFLALEGPYADARAEFARLVAGENPTQSENAVLTRSGKKRIVSWRNSALKQQGEVVGTLSFGLDITERREQEIQLREYHSRLKALASDLTISEERERRRIAEELHDGPLQVLAFTRMRLASARSQANADARERVLDEVAESLRRATLDTSRVVTDLNSPALQELGFTVAISDWAQEQIQRRFGIETTVISHLGETEERALDDLSRALLFRNVRELLTNVVKHARASSVRVSLERAGGNLEVTVRDNGQGCNPDLASSGTGGEGGFGLFSIRERMADLGGGLEIECVPGHGFAATLIFPLAGTRPRKRTRHASKDNAEEWVE